MKLKPSLKQIKDDLKHLSKYEVVIYGSYATGDFTSRSDIDIAIITRKKNKNQNIKIWKEALKKTKLPYQIKIFELLPLQIKADIIDNSIVLFGNRINLSEYFYHYRKLWQDMKHRYYTNQFTHFREKIEKMKVNL